MNGLNFWDSLQVGLDDLFREEQPDDDSDVDESTFPLGKLKRDYLSHIFTLCSYKDACQFRLVCRVWNKVASLTTLWKHYLNTDRTLRRKWRFITLPSNYQNLPNLFQTAAFHYQLGKVSNREGFRVLKRKYDDDIPKMGCLSTKRLRVDDDVSMGELLIPDKRPRQLQVLDISGSIINKRTLQLSFAIMGKQNTPLRRVVAYSSNVDDSVLDVIGKYCPTLKELDLTYSKVTEEGKNKLQKLNPSLKFPLPKQKKRKRRVLRDL